MDDELLAYTLWLAREGYLTYPHKNRLRAEALVNEYRQSIPLSSIEHDTAKEPLKKSRHMFILLSVTFIAWLVSLGVLAATWRRIEKEDELWIEFDYNEDEEDGI